jgi:hypothetical protein
MTGGHQSMARSVRERAEASKVCILAEGRDTAAERGGLDDG